MLTPGHERIDEKTYSQLWSLLKDPNTQSEILTEEEIQQRRTTEYTGEDRIQTHYSETDAYDSLDTLSDALGWKPQI